MALMFERWRYRGRHRGYFLDCYRSAEAWAEAERLTARWCSILDADIAAHIKAAHQQLIGQVLVRDYVPDDLGVDEPPLWMPLGREPTIVFDEPCRHDRSGLSLWNLEQLAADLGITWPTVTVRLWLRGDEIDDDDRARYDRLMGMAGA